MANQLNAIQNINKELDVTVQKLGNVQMSIVKISQASEKGIGNISLPKDLEANSKAAENTISSLTKELDNQRKVTLKLSQDIAKLREARSRSTKKGIEQRVAETALRKELRQQVRATIDLGSAYDNLAAKNNALIRERQNLSVRQKTNNDLTEQEIARLNELTATIQKNQGILKSTDAEIGNFRRNVGNYASSWDGLGNSINQISREFPAFAVSTQTGILALSNNIPILADEINRLIATNRELIAQGKPTVSVFRRIGKAILGWQTLLSIGVSLITIYAKEIGNLISRLFDTEDALDSATKAQKALNEAQIEGGKAVASEVSELQFLFDISKDITQSTETREKAAQKLIDTSEGLISQTEKQNILNGTALEAEQKLTQALIQRGVIEAILNKNAETFSKIIENNVKLTQLREERSKTLSIEELRAAREKAIADGKEIKNNQDLIGVLGEVTINKRKAGQLDEQIGELTEENNKLQEDSNALFAEAAKFANSFSLGLTNVSSSLNNFNEKLNKSSFDLAEFRLQRVIDLNKSILENEENTTEKRILASIKLQEGQRKLAKLRRDFELSSLELEEENRIKAARKEIKDEKKLENEIFAIENDILNKRKLVNEKFQQNITNINKEAQESNIKIYSDEFKRRIQIIEDFAKRSEIEFNDEISRLQDSLRKRGALEEDIEEQVNDRVRKLRIKQLKELINLTLKELEVISITYEERILLEERLAKLRAKLSDEELDDFLTKEERRRRILRDSINEISKTLNDVFGINSSSTERFFNTLITNFDQIRKKGKASFEEVAEIAGASFDFISEVSSAAFQRNIDNLDRQIQANNEYFDKILDNQELSDEQRESLENERERRETELQNKRNQELQKQARAKKAFDAAEVIANTAVAVSKALAQGGFLLGIPFSTVVAALGAVQLATVLAQPIPQFAEGKNFNDNYEGMAIWGERKRELKISKDGSMELSPKRIANHLTHVKKDDIIIPDANKYLNNLSDEELTRDLQKHIVMANVSHNNYLSDKYDLIKGMDISNEKAADKIVKAINKKQQNFNVYNNLSLGKDIKFAKYLDDIL